MTKIKIIKRALQSEKYAQGVIDALEYLETEGQGRAGLKELAEALQEDTDQGSLFNQKD